MSPDSRDRRGWANEVHRAAVSRIVHSAERPQPGGFMSRLIGCLALMYMAACVASASPPLAAPASRGAAVATGADGEPVGGNEIVSHAGVQTCSSGSVCAWQCNEGNCPFVCQTGATCSVRCDGGNCQLDCAPGATCNESCDGGHCRSQCGSGTTCTLDCDGGNCANTCAQDASCAIRCDGGNCH